MALVVPSISNQIRHGTKAGVLDSDGTFVRASGLNRARGIMTKSPKKPEVVDQKVLDDAYYGGFLKPHFGHFILEGLSRLWPMRDSHLPIVWASGNENLTDWQQFAFQCLGIDPKRFIFPKIAMRVRQLIVPKQGYVIQTEFHSTHRDFLSVFGVSSQREKKVYLSRSKFRSSICNIVNEELIEARLQSLGWEIVCPEEISLAEQIDIFRTSEAVAGIEGSAFHTVVFCSNVKAKIILIRRPEPNKNYDTIAVAKKLNQINIDYELTITPDKMSVQSLEILDPKRLAAKIEACV